MERARRRSSASMLQSLHQEGMVLYKIELCHMSWQVHTSKPKEMIIGRNIILKDQGRATKNGAVVGRLGSLCKDLYVGMCVWRDQNRECSHGKNELNQRSSWVYAHEFYQSLHQEGMVLYKIELWRMSWQIHTSKLREMITGGIIILNAHQDQEWGCSEKVKQLM